MKKVTYVKFILDLLMALTFVLLFNKRVLGGLAFHEIAGLAISVAFITHILLNLNWVIKVTAKLFDRKLPGMTRFSYLLNLLLLISMTFIVVSGILISEIVFPGFHIGNTPWFKISHISVSFLGLILIGVHVGLHWKWVVNVAKKMVRVKSSKAPLGIIAKVLAALILLFGGYQMYSTQFISRVQGIGTVFNMTGSGTPPAGFKQRGGDLRGGDMGGENPNFGTRPNRMEGDHREGGFGGGSPNALGVILTYFGIMGVFVIITYYLTKLGSRKKRRTTALSSPAELDS
ncbi:DUF4405 domain-containing protein [Paenibacillus zeisoli]|uniref:DUF4405 domain-containing protein n=1 Tax=Paenibacillus zeisoli TaxID=2496267 RepID=A0A3S1DB98_9BACL|nr:DUF4405 domain-containing protein [Paenibacillus zeisoli]RUT33575.1 DUF4405 domain-containing protein [Paenibacillus zeisoli]